MGKQDRKKKVPHYTHDGPTLKSPKIDPGFSTEEQFTPVWLLQRLEFEGPFGWKGIDSCSKIVDVISKLKNFETMRWDEILGAQHHEVRVRDLSREAQKRLEQIGLEDIDQLVSLRLTGRERVWGIRLQRNMNLLWWDPNHQVCPSLKKHT